MGLKPAFDEGQKEGKFKISDIIKAKNQQEAYLNNVSHIDEPQ